MKTFDEFINEGHHFLKSVGKKCKNIILKIGDVNIAILRHDNFINIVEITMDESLDSVNAISLDIKIPDRNAAENTYKLLGNAMGMRAKKDKLPYANVITAIHDNIDLLFDGNDYKEEYVNDVKSRGTFTADVLTNQDFIIEEVS